MPDPRAERLVRAALTGRLSRRQALDAGLRLGLATPVLTALVAATPAETQASRPMPVRTLNQGGTSGTLTVLIESASEDIDPHNSYGTVSQMTILGLYEMLLQYKGASIDEFAPMLADSWEASADGTSYTFRLAPGITFHDGTPCDAQAVKDSFGRFLLFEGGPVNVISRFVESPDQIVAVDPQTVRFDLGGPQPLFLAAMASSYGPYVVSPTAVAENSTDEDPYAHEFFVADAVGTGPYRLVENSLSEQIVLERFEEYHRGWEGNHFDRVVLRVVPENATRRQLLERGEADATTYTLTPEDVAALQGNPVVKVEVYGTTRCDWVIMNAPRLLTPGVRQGFSLAFPYGEVIDGVFQGLMKRSGPIASSVRGSDPDVFLYQTDLVAAKQRILEGGFQEGDRFQYLYASGSETDRAVAQLFQANVAEMGFELELEEVDGGSLETLVFGDVPAEERPHFIGGWEWWPDYNDPWNQLAPNFLEESIGSGGSNGGYWVNPRFEELMAEAAQYTDEAQLRALMTEAQAILTEQDPPCIYVGETQLYTILKNDIDGFVANPLYLEAYPFYAMSRAAT